MWGQEEGQPSFFKNPKGENNQPAEPRDVQGGHQGLLGNVQEEKKETGGSSTLKKC